MKAVKTFNTYQQRTTLTANHPEKYAENYLYSGLTEECAEVLGKYAKRYRGDFDNNPQLFKDYLKKELGDVMWFVAQVALLNRTKLSVVTGVNTIERYAPDISFYLRREADLAHEMVKIATLIYDGELMYCVADVESLRKSLIFQLEEIVARVYILAKENDFTMTEILNHNLDKLHDRKERNVIKGSGDKR